MKGDPQPSVMYRSNGVGRWWRSETQPQCIDKDDFGLRCQGVHGHEGVHWAYQPNGSYACWKNEADPDSIDQNVGAMWIPPESANYVHPKDKKDFYYVTFSRTTEVVDREVIQRLENLDPPEAGASIDKPSSMEKIQRLK